MILTDGAVDDRNGTIQLVKNFSEKCRVFVLGIGSGVDTALVSGLSKEGNGQHSLVSQARDIEDVTMTLYQKVLQPIYRDVSLVLPKGYTQIPASLPPIKEKMRLIAYGIPYGKVVEPLDNIIVKFKDPEGSIQEVEINRIREIDGDTIKKRAALTLIDEYEKKK